MKFLIQKSESENKKLVHLLIIMCYIIGNVLAKFLAKVAYLCINTKILKKKT